MEVGHGLHGAEIGWGADGGAGWRAGEGVGVLATSLGGLLEACVDSFDANCVGYWEDVVEVCEDCGAEAGGPAAGIDDDGRRSFLPFPGFQE